MPGLNSISMFTDLLDLPELLGRGRGVAAADSVR